MFHCYFPALDYYSQEGFATYEQAREWGYSKGFSFAVFQRIDGQWVKVNPY